MSEFGSSLWSMVQGQLRGTALQWWEDNQAHLVDLTREEVEDFLIALKSGDAFDAKLEIATRMEPPQWRAYRNGTTDKLHGIAARRAALLDALEDLARRAAKTLGKAGVSALGL